METGYTVRVAARRMGITEASVRQRIEAGKLTVVEGATPIQVRTEQVDAARAEALAKFSDVIDATQLAVVPELPTGLVAEWLRAMAAAQELADDGIERIRRSNRLLLDSLISALPITQ